MQTHPCLLKIISVNFTKISRLFFLYVQLTVLRPSNFQQSILHCGSLVERYDKNAIFLFSWESLLQIGMQDSAMYREQVDLPESLHVLIYFTTDSIKRLSIEKSVQNLFSIMCSVAFKFREFWTVIPTRTTWIHTEPDWISWFENIISECDDSKYESNKTMFNRCPVPEWAMGRSIWGSEEQRGSQRKFGVPYGRILLAPRQSHGRRNGIWSLWLQQVVKLWPRGNSNELKYISRQNYFTRLDGFSQPGNLNDNNPSFWDSPFVCHVSDL